MVKTHQPTSIIIDFGLTFSLDAYKPKDVFFMYVNDYSPWTLDQTMISYAINKVNDWENKKVNIAAIQYVINDFVKYRNFLNVKNQAKYIKEQKTYYEKYVTKTWKELYDDLMEQTYFWDIYALCNVYYSFINYDNMLQKRYQSFIVFLESLMLASPDQRKTHKVIIEDFKTLMSIKTTPKTSPKTPTPTKKAIDKIEKSILKNRISELKNSRKLRTQSKKRSKPKSQQRLATK